MSPQSVRRCAPPGAALLVLLSLTACGEPAAPDTAAAPASPSAPDAPVAPAAPAAPAAAPAAEKTVGVPADYDCAGTAIEVIPLEHAAILQLDGESIRLSPVAAASGARYQGWRADGVAVDFWEKGGSAMLSVAGNAYPECSRVETPATAAGDAASDATTSAEAPVSATAAPYAARGNEPFWLVQADATEVRWSTPDHVSPDVFTGLTRTARANGFDLAAARDGRAFALAATVQPCRDSMTGMPYPHTVIVTVDGREFSGCGGAPLDLLTPNEWTVASIGGAPSRERAPTLQFSADGRASGFAGCNRWTSMAELTGEGLSFPHPASTMMACPGDAEQQERAFLDALGRVTRFDVDANGDLLLKAGDETVIVAKASKP